MNKDELTKRLARESHRSRAEAADDVDKLVYRLLKDLKRPAEIVRKDPLKTPPKAKA
jgi:nucleoid DNA-binding protein